MTDSQDGASEPFLLDDSAVTFSPQYGSEPYQHSALNKIEENWSGVAANRGDPIPVAHPALPEGSPGLIQPPYPAPVGIMNIPQLPDASRWWQNNRPLMFLWMGVSILEVLICILWPVALSFVAGVIGIVGASLHVCTCCGGSGLSGPVKAIMVLGYVACGFGMLTILLHILLLCLGFISSDCSMSYDSGCVTIQPLWFAFHELVILSQAVISAVVSQRGRKMQKMLNPVTAGTVVL